MSVSDEDEDEEEEDEEEEELPYSTANIDIDAIASAKSLGERPERKRYFFSPCVFVVVVINKFSPGDAMRLLAPQLEGLPRRSRGKYGKRKHLSPEEKAELTRRRNRENARSTRMRRKMYIDHLQSVADSLKQRHDELSAKMSSPPPDGYSRRREAVRRFFEMRGDCETNEDKWLRVLAADVQLTLPLTNDDDDDEEHGEPHYRRLRGAAAVAKHSQKLKSFLEDLGDRRSQATAQQQQAPTLLYQVDPGSIVHVGHCYMCQWTATIARQEGDFHLSVSHSGMARCTFTSQHTIYHVDLRFDVFAFTAIIDDFIAAPQPPRLSNGPPPQQHYHNGIRSRSQ